MKSPVHLLGHTLTVAGLVMLSYPIASWVYAGAFQAYESWVFDRAEMHSVVPQARPYGHL